jgi:hypothetical protein
MSGLQTGGNTMKQLTVLMLLLGAVLGSALARANEVFAPPPVEVVAADAEDLALHYLRGDWQGAGPLVTEVRATTPQLATLMQSRHLAPAKVDRLAALTHRLEQSNQARRDPVGAARTANDINGLALDVRTLFPTRVPSSVERLGYLGRNLLIDVRAGSPPAQMHATVRDIRDTWRTLAPSIKERGGSDVAKATSTAVDALDHANGAAQWREAAQQLLAQVEPLENLYVL